MWLCRFVSGTILQGHHEGALIMPKYLNYSRRFSRPPPIDVNTTDNLLVHVMNSLDQPSTLHHHGMFFNSTSWMDGVLGVSEW